MADNEMMTRLKSMVDVSECENPLLKDVLSIAKTKVLNRLYPYDVDRTEVPKRYEKNVLEIAVYLFNRLGSEGELSHSEGSISRTYESASVPESMLKEIVPFCGVIL